MLDKNLNFQEPQIPHLSGGWVPAILDPSVVGAKGLCSPSFTQRRSLGKLGTGKDIIRRRFGSRLFLRFPRMSLG